MDYKDKIILVTGASSDIGNHLANTLASKNATVIGIYNKTKIDNSKFINYKCDITKEKYIKKLMKMIKNKYGYINILINGAALSLDNDMYSKTKKEFMKVLEVNLVGTFLMCKYASLLMDNGVIINIASTDGIDTYSVFSMDYSSSKAGIINLTKNLANRLNNIKVCGIAPNWVKTKSVLEMNKDYLEEAGPENEAAVIKELGSPETVA